MIFDEEPDIFGHLSGFIIGYVYIFFKDFSYLLKEQNYSRIHQYSSRSHSPITSSSRSPSPITSSSSTSSSSPSSEWEDTSFSNVKVKPGPFPGSHIYKMSSGATILSLNN